MSLISRELRSLLRLWIWIMESRKSLVLIASFSLWSDRIRAGESLIIKLNYCSWSSYLVIILIRYLSVFSLRERSLLLLYYSFPTSVKTSINPSIICFAGIMERTFIFSTWNSFLNFSEIYGHSWVKRCFNKSTKNYWTSFYSTKVWILQIISLNLNKLL